MSTTIAIQQTLDFASGARITNLPAPASANEPARLADLNAAIEGLAWKDDVRVASIANINLASPGASVNGISMVSGDRFLAKDQTTPAENGIYIWNGSAVAATRALDASTSDELENAVVTVGEGTSAGSSFRQTSVNFTIGVGAVAWANFGNAAPAATETLAGIAEIATQSETDTGTDDLRFVTPLKLANWAKTPKGFASNIGDGSATAYVVTHNFNTFDVAVTVFRNSGNRDDIIVSIDRTSVNAVTITFASAPASNAFRVLVNKIIQ